MKPPEELSHVRKRLVDIASKIENLLQEQKELLKRKNDLELHLQAENVRTANELHDADFNKTDFPWSTKVDAALKNVFKINAFRPLQLQTINATLSNKDCILIMPTGGGKSLCFQLPAIISNGVTVVVSPLVSLMEDQQMSLQQLGIAVAILNAGVDKTIAAQTMTSLTDSQSNLKLVYVTPEKLAKSKRMMNKLEKMYDMGRFTRLVIDEVHCCSQWGHDFRPDFKFLGVMRRQFPKVSILGFTATATSRVIEDCRQMLGLGLDCIIFKASFNRPNLFYEVHRKPSVGSESYSELCKIINKRFSGQSGIVYCLSKKDCEDVACALQSNGIKSGAYHADLTAVYRSRLHRNWIDNKIQVVVATIAFGMGIDKPNVRFVIHHSISKSMENYYQESGRAGRDDEPAYCILFTSMQDAFRQSTMVFETKTGLEKLYGMLSYAFQFTRCRRNLIAEHFGEVWSDADCNRMCDRCSRGGTTGLVEQDVTSHARDLIAYLELASSANQKLTALKLLDLWYGKGGAALRIKTATVPSFDRDIASGVLINFLLEGVFKEKFHYTAYTTISYIEPGPLANSVKKGTFTLKLPLPSNRTKQLNSSKPQLKGKDCDPPKPSEISKERPLKRVLPTILRNTDSHDAKRSVSLKRIRTQKLTQKLLEDDSELDFGSDPSDNDAKKMKRHSNSANDCKKEKTLPEVSMTEYDDITIIGVQSGSDDCCETKATESDMNCEMILDDDSDFE